MTPHMDAFKEPQAPPPPSVLKACTSRALMAVVKEVLQLIPALMCAAITFIGVTQLKCTFMTCSTAA